MTLRTLKDEVEKVLSKRSSWSFVVALVSACVCSFLFNGCGQNEYFANRVLPPSGILNRCLVAIQNPNALTKGSLQILDAYYDIRHAYNNINKTYFINGYNGSDPVTIQNFAIQQAGLVYSIGDGTLVEINYATEATGSTVRGFSGPSSSVFGAQNLNYYVAASQQVHALTIIDQTTGGGIFPLDVPGVFRVSINPSGTIALGFLQNSNAVYSVVRLTQAQQAQLKGGPSTWSTLSPYVQDCEPQNLPIYCAVQVNDPNKIFDRPIKAIFSSDGSTAYVVNCGIECGGTAAGIVTIPLTGSTVNIGVAGPSAINLVPSATVIATPGGATDALQSGSTLYVSGQQLQASGPYSGLFGGNLSVINLSSGTVQGTYSISDGNHTKMILADDNTLWLGSQSCEDGVNFQKNQNADPSALPLGCLTMFNTSTHKVTVDTYKGDLTGVTDIEGLQKVYVAEGGQVHIYNTTDGSERDNTNVTVIGTAYDVAYMDATTDGDDANY